MSNCGSDPKNDATVPYRELFHQRNYPDVLKVWTVLNEKTNNTLNRLADFVDENHLDGHIWIAGGSIVRAICEIDFPNYADVDIWVDPSVTREILVEMLTKVFFDSFVAINDTTILIVGRDMCNIQIIGVSRGPFETVSHFDSEHTKAFIGFHDQEIQFWATQEAVQCWKSRIIMHGPRDTCNVIERWRKILEMGFKASPTSSYKYVECIPAFKDSTRHNEWKQKFYSISTQDKSTEERHIFMISSIFNIPKRRIRHVRRVDIDFLIEWYRISPEHMQSYGIMKKT